MKLHKKLMVVFLLGLTAVSLQRTKETLNSLLKSHQVNDIYTLNPEHLTVELNPVVN